MPPPVLSAVGRAFGGQTYLDSINAAAEAETEREGEGRRTKKIFIRKRRQFNCMIAESPTEYGNLFGHLNLRGPDTLHLSLKAEVQTYQKSFYS